MAGEMSAQNWRDKIAALKQAYNDYNAKAPEAKDFDHQDRYGSAKAQYESKKAQGKSALEAAMGPSVTKGGGGGDSNPMAGMTGQGQAGKKETGMAAKGLPMIQPKGKQGIQRGESPIFRRRQYPRQDYHLQMSPGSDRVFRIPRSQDERRSI